MIIIYLRHGGVTTLRDKDLYTTANRCLQCLIKMIYTAL